ncbi:MAG: hypothetical protein KJ626_07780, partial [Verrucomicrobia bacterium]|nr:hypothetical protein [Verrucomicrobiota bacterium]
VFADGFAGAKRILSSNDAEHRPMGLAVGPGGSLYISDSCKGRIWRVSWHAHQRRLKDVTASADL